MTHGVLVLAVATTLFCVGCADENESYPPLASASNATAEQVPSMSGYVLPACGSVDFARWCNVNEAAFNVFVEVEDTDFAWWVEQMRAWSEYALRNDYTTPSPRELTLNIQFALGSRPGELFEGNGSVPVLHEFNGLLWTNGTLVRAYFPLVVLVNNIAGIPNCNLLNFEACTYVIDTFSLRGAYFEARHPQSSQLQFFPSVAQIDTTWVTVQYLRDP